ncbi:hypothetical protein NESM_000675200 [Novymonas esmeraldas]|uniref:Uncharacterized protein n=1 Tax=Novymonas esmeraldas TaxID=1808958 RepID=A0AAW0EW33_9TRYP
MDEYGTEDVNQIEDGNESNAALLQLQDAFVNALTASGALGKIRAQLRASALALIRGDDDLQDAAVGPVVRPMALSSGAKVSLLLLYDFLQHHHLHQTAGVLEVEGSMHLLSNERASLLGGLAQLPGDGSLLERLLQSHEADKEKGRIVNPPSTTTAAAAAAPSPPEGPAAADLSVSRSATEDAGLAGPPPDDADVLYELERYDDSIPFSDTDTPIDAHDACDELDAPPQ